MLVKGRLFRGNKENTIARKMKIIATSSLF